MFKYKVNIRKSYGELSEDSKLVDGKIYKFRPTFRIYGGHAEGEVMMVPMDKNYPKEGPKFLALGDLELL